MKKSLKRINNEKGHMLIFVLITATITIALFIGAVKIYTKTIEETDFILNQLEVETISQMSQVDLLKIKETDGILKSNYHFIYPNGEIFLKLIQKTNNRYLIDQDIILKNKSAYQVTFEAHFE